MRGTAEKTPLSLESPLSGFQKRQAVPNVPKSGEKCQMTGEGADAATHTFAGGLLLPLSRSFTGSSTPRRGAAPPTAITTIQSRVTSALPAAVAGGGSSRPSP